MFKLPSYDIVFQDIEYIRSVYDKMHKLVERGTDKKLKPEYDTICKIMALLEEDKKHIRFADWDTKEVTKFTANFSLSNNLIILLLAIFHYLFTF